MKNKLKLALFWTKIVAWKFIVEEICVSLVLMLNLLNFSNKMVGNMSIVTTEVIFLWKFDIFPKWEVTQKGVSYLATWTLKFQYLEHRV